MLENNIISNYGCSKIVDKWTGTCMDSNCRYINFFYKQSIYIYIYALAFLSMLVMARK